MKNKVKMFMNFSFDRYQSIETKLEKLAAKGLLLDECGGFFWTFNKSEPTSLKYTVTYFSEGSIFNPDVTDHQQTYLDYAAAAGWKFVTQFNQMQIFSSSIDNPIPFETDEREKLDNIKKCMKKSFIPSTLILLLVFMLNLAVQFSSFQLNPIDFLSNTTRLLSVSMFLAIVLYYLYLLLDYFIWCKRCERSISNGVECTKNFSKPRRIIDIVFICFIVGILGCFLFNMAYELNFFALLFALVQTPIMLLVFWSSIKHLKNKKTSAIINKVVSYALLILVNFAYITLMLICLFTFDFSAEDKSEFRTVNWPVSATSSHEYRLYSDDIPLTCEALYGDVDYEYYSYEKEASDTFLLKKSAYRQDSLPAQNAPPHIEYDILTPQFDFVHHLVKKHLLEIPQWRETMSFHTVYNQLFGTVEAYQAYYGNAPTGEYILIFEDKIIVLKLEAPPTTSQISIIKEALQI